MQSSDQQIEDTSSLVNLSARFWVKVNKDGPTMPHMESPCWMWTACKTSTGYGNIKVGGKMIKAHRVAWTITNGPIPQGEGYHGTVVMHRCDNPLCVRVDHLFLGTHTDNMRDMISKGRNGHTKTESRPRGEAHSNSKLTTSDVVEIRAAYAAGGTNQRRLAAQFRVSQRLICSIVLHRVWAHI